MSTEIEIVKSAKAFAIIDSIHKLDGGCLVKNIRIITDSFGVERNGILTSLIQFYANALQVEDFESCRVLKEEIISYL